MKPPTRTVTDVALFELEVAVNATSCQSSPRIISPFQIPARQKSLFRFADTAAAGPDTTGSLSSENVRLRVEYTSTDLYQWLEYHSSLAASDNHLFSFRDPHRHFPNMCLVIHRKSLCPKVGFRTWNRPQRVNGIGALGTLCLRQYIKRYRLRVGNLDAL
jgi:hypothetical protein